MASQVYFALKGSGTEIADERLVTSVLAGVCDQIGRLREGFAANIALVWLLPGVDVGVFLHVRLLVEAFACASKMVNTVNPMSEHTTYHNKYRGMGVCPSGSACVWTGWRTV